MVYMRLTLKVDYICTLIPPWSIYPLLCVYHPSIHTSINTHATIPFSVVDTSSSDMCVPLLLPQ